jgi:hypothetical protein
MIRYWLAAALLYLALVSLFFRVELRRTALSPNGERTREVQQVDR